MRWYVHFRHTRSSGPCPKRRSHHRLSASCKAKIASRQRRGFRVPEARRQCEAPAGQQRAHRDRLQQVVRERHPPGRREPAHQRGRRAPEEERGVGERQGRTEGPGQRRHRGVGAEAVHLRLGVQQHPVDECRRQSDDEPDHECRAPRRRSAVREPAGTLRVHAGQHQRDSHRQADQVCHHDVGEQAHPRRQLCEITGLGEDSEIGFQFAGQFDRFRHAARHAPRQQGGQRECADPPQGNGSPQRGQTVAVVHQQHEPGERVHLRDVTEVEQHAVQDAEAEEEEHAASEDRVRRGSQRCAVCRAAAQIPRRTAWRTGA